MPLCWEFFFFLGLFLVLLCHLFECFILFLELSSLFLFSGLFQMLVKSLILFCVFCLVFLDFILQLTVFFPICLFYHDSIMLCLSLQISGFIPYRLIIITLPSTEMKRINQYDSSFFPRFAFLFGLFDQVTAQVYLRHRSLRLWMTWEMYPVFPLSPTGTQDPQSRPLCLLLRLSMPHHLGCGL